MRQFSGGTREKGKGKREKGKGQGPKEDDRESRCGYGAVLDAQDDGGPSSGKVVVVRGDEDRPILTAEPREQLTELVAS